MFVETIAIIIGVSEYLQRNIPSLPGAEIDAVNLSRALRNWGVPEENTLLILNQEACAETVDNFLKLVAERNKECKLIFYFCGHGYRTKDEIPKSYLVFYDSLIDSGDCSRSFSLDSFLETIAKMNILESYIFIDACHLRVNAFINPKLEAEVRGDLSSQKSLFCLLSSGIEESFECVNGQYGFFTRALLNSLCTIRKVEGSTTQFLQNIQDELREEGLPLPEMVNFGNQRISLIPKCDDIIDQLGYVNRIEFISEIQDAFIQNKNKIISIFGEEGCGKTTICRWLASEKMKVFYIEIPCGGKSSINPEILICQKIYEKFGCTIEEFDREYPFYLVVFDQLERLGVDQRDRLLENLLKFRNLRFLCASRLRIGGQEIHSIHVPSLSLDEGNSFIKKMKPSCTAREAELAYLISQGNLLRMRKIISVDMNFDDIEDSELKKAIAAIHSCGAYYDKKIFENVFDLQAGMLDFFENVGLVLYIENSYVPHHFLSEFAAFKSLNADPQAVLKYWSEQATFFPTNSEIAKSLILAVKCFGYEKSLEKPLVGAFKCLSVSRENLSYFIDGAEILSSLTCRTRATIKVGRSLRELGENELSNGLLNKKSDPLGRLGTFVTFGILVVCFLCFGFWSQTSAGPHHVYMKQIHPDFVGRENYLDLLKNKLIKERAEGIVPVTVLWGEGGIGKSEIAITFANKNLKSFDLVYSIDSATSESYLSAYQDLATQLDISFNQSDSIVKLVRMVHNYLENNDRFAWLLVFDNAEIEYDLPQRGNGAVVVTTRNKSCWHLYPCYEVTSFLESEALSLFKKITRKEGDSSRLTLIRELEDFPLSLNLAAHYVAETPWMSEQSYIDLVSRNKVGLMNTSPAGGRYQNGFVNSWKMTAEQLYKQNPKALEWLHFSSYLYPGKIPSSWIEEWLIFSSKEELSHDSLRLEVNEILRLIANQSLMRCDKNSENLSVHRLKQDVFLSDKYSDPDIKEMVIEFLVHSLEGVERIDEMERSVQLRPKLRNWELHAVWFLDKYGESCSKDKIAQLNNLLGSWKTIKGEYALAENYIDQALRIRMDLFGSEDFRTVTAMSNKGWILWKLNKLEESKAAYLMALESLEKSISKDQTSVTFIMNNLSLVLSDLHEYELMKQMNEKNLQVRVGVYGEKHVYTADSKHNLGVAHLKLTEYEAAQKYFEQSLDCYILYYGLDHPYVAITKHNIARTLLGKGECLRARELFDQVIGLYAKHYGEDHPYVALCWQNKGQLFVKLGQEKEAVDAFKKALVGLSKVYEKDHYSISSVLDDLEQFSKKLVDSVLAEEVEQIKRLSDS